MADEEVGLPKATIQKIIKDKCPDMKVAGDLAEMIGRCAAELIHILGSQAQEECEKEKKKLLMGEHIVKALETLEFKTLAENSASLLQTLADEEKGARAQKREKKAQQNQGMSHEELVALQQQMLNAARERTYAAAAQGEEEDLGEDLEDD